MKKPIIKEYERKEFNEDSFIGAQTRLKFALLKFKRDLYQRHNFVTAWLIYRNIMKSKITLTLKRSNDEK